MSYQVLARKWRPKNFKEMAGQAHVLQTLVHALESGRLHHAYLFTGTRGVGKTTVARILAKCLNCDEGVTATPCEKCDSCREIAEGRFIDLIEVDAASRTKVEDTRELLENVQYAPSRGRYKVYLIDEVHMLSTHSFNALLKTLEEPPPHVKFLLATTDPHKLPVTILSRCLQFNLKNFMPDKIVEYLQSVLTAEQVEFEEPALWHLARAAHGSMRDALTLLDQAISYGEGKVSDSSVQALLGTPAQMQVFGLLDSINARNAAELLNGAAEIAKYNANYMQILESILSVLHRSAIAQVLPKAIDNSNGDKEHILKLANSLPPEDIHLYYQITLKAQSDFNLAPDLQMAFDMYLLRMLAFTPDGPAVSQPATTAAAPIDDSSAETEEQKKKRLNPVAEPKIVSKPEIEEVAEQQAENSANNRVSSPPAITQENWPSIVQACLLSGISANLLANSVPENVTESQIDLVIDETQSALFNEQYIAIINTALNDYFERQLQVAIRTGVTATESPAARSQRIRQELRQEAIKNFNNDENVCEIMQKFSATIKPDSLKLSTEERK